MSIHVALNHVTHYRYDRAIKLGPQVVRLRPAPHSRTRVLSYSMRVEPAQHFINWQQDPQSNHLARLVFPDPTTELRIEIDLVVEMAVLNPFDFFLEPSAEAFPFDYEPALAKELAPYLERAPLTPRFKAYLDSIPREPVPTNSFLVSLNQRLQRDIAYLIRMEPGVQTPETTLANASGSCRDSGWLLVQLMRHLGLAARFVSGYLIQLKSDVKSLDGPSGTEVDFTDLHAWCEVYLPGAGWIGLDPTSGLLAGEGHIPLACSPDPLSAAPISGELEACETRFEHRMSVERIWESPRTTLPYSDAQWASIDALGRKVDEDLLRDDVRLTQGGEPTFIADADREAGEWNTEAMGPTKLGLAKSLMGRLVERYGAGALQHTGQGKWYPGEQVPRWSLNLFWRADREPLWTRPALFATEPRPGGATEGQAREFLAGVAARLRVDAVHVFPAFEDAAYALWRERRLPINVDPLDSRLADPLERERMARLFGDGLQRVVGHVLPVGRNPAPQARQRWQSGPWYLRAERCLLVPGDSAMGWRLPLDSQPWARDADLPWVHPSDPNQPLDRLPSHGSPEPGEVIDAGAPVRPPAAFESASAIVRTALAAQPRDGRLWVFMPPLAALEDYVELIAAIEATAAELNLPLMLEGYEPPKDPRLVNLRVTPDPGVIEVNVHPAHSWSELVAQTTHLYDAAHQTRLSSEKFMIDGRHTGTGGGNHFVLGGATPGDSPFLRRPDLLASMVAYWHNHPALSYLFSGLFVGPTSQAPRLDEARNDAVYEIEVAFAELDRALKQGKGACPPWLIDRVLRNLLVDVTGNTHRAEFCIDKLYSPDGPTGRLGLLEMRAFEMPPHARMSLAQQLLMRALVARFWRDPYRPVRLQRWGTELHDRFMLPHFIEHDFNQVLVELGAHGYAMPASWFAPHLNFRFPLLGDFAAAGVEVELRLALEPWHVLGEEGGPGGTSRYVDSTLERIQVLATGVIDGRHVLTCNGRRIPMQPTGKVGEAVGAVRFRAWHTASALHPTIDPQAPLTFDLVDRSAERSLGGCQYHVAHPGGRSYATFPVNALEAEARRLARFFRTGHTPGRMSVPDEERNPDFPFTLDLRRR